MSTVSTIASALDDPRKLEELYRTVEAAGDVAAFRREIDRLFAEHPDSPLLAAWHYRLQPTGLAADRIRKAQRIPWPLAIPLGLILGLVYWPLTDSRVVLSGGAPYLLFLWAPLAGAAIVGLTTLGAAGRKPWLWAAGVVVGLAAISGYVLWLVPQAHSHYETIATIHLPILALVGIGLIVAGRGSDDRNRFAFLIKSTEAVVTGGIYGGAAAFFLAVTFGLFDAIGVLIPDPVGRLLLSLAAGLVPLLAVAAVYDPALAPVEQRFEEGLSKLIFSLGRFFLPLTFAVGVVYVVSIPFNFWRPFEQRDVLIVYNVMLFAIMGLLIFATPVQTGGLSQSILLWLRRGIVAVAVLTILVSLYALSATVYRTVMGGITVNRLTIIGWNVINTVLLLDLVYRQMRTSGAAWPAGVWRTCRWGMMAYAVWALFLLVAIPWLFGR